jgi:hypothetical protein
MHFNVTRSLELLSVTGERIPFSIIFGPLSQDGQDFKCKVAFDGWDQPSREIWGYDSLQAFLLAVQFSISILKLNVDRGQRIVWPNSDDDYCLDDWHISKDTNAA